MSIRRLNILLSLCWFAIALPGCGKKAGDQKTGALERRGVPKEVMQKPEEGAKQAAEPPATPRFAPAAGMNNSPNASEKIPGVKASDLFVVVKDEAPRPGTVFDLLGKEPKFKPEDLASIVPPPPGTDSTKFVIVSAVSQPEEGTTAGGVAVARARGNPGEGPADVRKSPALPAGFRPVPGSPPAADGRPLRIRCDKDGSEMAYVPGGQFLMGSSSGPSVSAPELSIVLDPYYIDVTEVTVARYETFREDFNTKSRSTRSLSPPLNANVPDKDVMAATGISWGDARNYAKWAGKDLPTEAEWEKAARGPKGFPHPWGEGRALWGRSRTPAQIDPVKSFAADVSPYGVYDLAGNVREWCLDWFSPTSHAQGAASKGDTLVNWKGVRSGSPATFRVVKGNGPAWEAYFRMGLTMSERRPDVGFRCVLHVPKLDDPAGPKSPTADPQRKSPAPTARRTIPRAAPTRKPGGTRPAQAK